MFHALAFVLLLASPASAQRTRLDTILAQTIASHLATAAVSSRIVFDTALTALQPIVNAHDRGPLPYRVDQAIGLIRTEDARPRMHISLMETYTPEGSTVAITRPWTADVDVDLTSQDQHDLETKASRFVHLEGMDTSEPKSFWESTMEPALVVVGAGLIVALFFLIRS